MEEKIKESRVRYVVGADPEDLDEPSTHKYKYGLDIIEVEVITDLAKGVLGIWHPDGRLEVIQRENLGFLKKGD